MVISQLHLQNYVMLDAFVLCIILGLFGLSDLMFATFSLLGFDNYGA